MAGPTALVTIPDVVAELNLPSTPADTTELQGFIDAATGVVEDYVGHVVNVSVTEVHDGGDVSIWLRETPVVSVQSITEVIGLIPYTLTEQPVGSPVDNFGYTLDDPASGMVVRRSAGSSPFPFFDNVGNVTVTYTAGRASVPANVRLGTLELIRHMYERGQQGMRPAYGAPADEAYGPTPAGYLVPNRVKELLQPSLKPIVFA